MIVTANDDVIAHATTLAERGDLVVAVRSLMEAGLVGEAAELLEEHAVRLVSLSEFDEACRAVDLVPPARRSFTVQVAHMDAVRHAIGVSTRKIEQLIARLEKAGEPELLLWARVILCEHLLLFGDLTSIGMAAQYLAEVPDTPYASSVVLQSRGRLRRMVAMAYLAAGPDGDDPGRAELDKAMAELFRASWRSEGWVSVPLYYLYATAASWSVPPKVFNTLKEARDQLLAMDSTQAHFARYLVLHAAWHLGDRASIVAELEELEKLDLTGEPEALVIIGRHLDAIAEAVLANRPEALERLGNVEDLRRVFPPMMATVVVRAAHAMLDLGRSQEAQVWIGRLVAAPPVLPTETVERDVLACRLALQTGDGSVADRLRSALDQVDARGHPRVSAGLTLRAAMDARRAGFTELAEELRLRAEPFLPPVSERTAWELYWAGTGPSAEPPAGTVGATTRTRSMRLLAPSLEVVVDGETRRLAPNVARLLVLLAVLGRAVGAEELSDLLWGEVDPALARGRLKSALHRLRQSLSLGPDELVVREGDVIRFQADPRWSIDLHDFYRLSTGDEQDRVAAYRLFDGLLCNAQFPYDDALAMERAVLETRWHTLADALLKAGTVEPGALRRQAARIGVALPDED